MIINRNFSNYIINSEEKILNGLNKIDSNKRKIVFLVSDNGVVLGSFSDGDFRRWVTKNKNVNLDEKISNAANFRFTYSNINENPEEIRKKIKDGIQIVPLLDKNKRIVAIAYDEEIGIKIGEKTISEKDPAYIIAEIGNNHNGCIKKAKKLIEIAKNAGADCAKFQMRDLKTLYSNSGNPNDASSDLGSQYTLDLLNKFQLKNSELKEAFDYCKELKITPLCTPWDISSLEVLEDYGMDAYKLSSADFTNSELLDVLIKTGKPLICSTGMSTEDEISLTIRRLNNSGSQYILMHCNSTYPTPYKDINLNYIKKLSGIGKCIVGYSGHERGYWIPLAAVAIGAKVIEKHITLDKSMEGNDHKVSLLPEELKNMISQIRDIEESLGSDGKRSLSQGEVINREVLAKSIITNKDLDIGEVISRDMLEIASPGIGLQPIYINNLIGKKSKRKLSKGDFFFKSDLSTSTAKSRNYKFNRPFGIPVRFHDYNELSKKSNIDFVEFHLSYKDLEISVKDYINESQSTNFSVHAPELFEEDHVLDLATNDHLYRRKSILLLSEVVEKTQEINNFFPNTKKPLIIINAGGWSKTQFLDPKEKIDLYNNVAESLKTINQKNVEIIIQTMPPFPWHFGGQSFHNLFVSPEEIKLFCKSHNVNICLDVSHSKLACNYYKWDLNKFVKEVSEYISYLHIVDAKKIDGEGLQIGEGEIDFIKLGHTLDKYAPNKPFIPEIWQGHKNQGEGFWTALEKLESFFN